MLVLVACCVTSVHYTSREAPLLFSRGGIRACPFSLRDFDKLRRMHAESLTYFLMSEQYKCIQWVAFGARGFPPSPHRLCTQTQSCTLMPCRMGPCRESSSASSMLVSCNNSVYCISNVCLL